VISQLITLPVKLTVRQYTHLKEIKKEHGISMAASIRSLIKMSMYGIYSGCSPQSGAMDMQNNKRQVRGGPSSAGQAAVVAELKRVFARRKSR